MIDDILQSAKQTALERLTSPLLGSFLLSWLAWNWKFLVILFSDNSVTTTFDLVNTLAFPDNTTLFLKGIFYPFLSSLAYVFLYPYPARSVYAFTLKRQRERNETKQQIARETLLTLEDSLQLRAEFVAHDRRSTETIQRLNNEITTLKAALDRNAQIGELEDPSIKDHQKITLSKYELDILRILETTGGGAKESTLIPLSSNERIQVEFAIGELLRRKLIVRNSSTAGGHLIKFTHEGRRALLSNR